MQHDDPASWKALMLLRPLAKDKYASIAPAYDPFSPPSTGSRAFGGHIYAQAAYAASRTVDDGFSIHHVTGYFLLPGSTDRPFLYTVRRIRDGKVYCLRAVEVFQDSAVAAKGETPCFVSHVSFKRQDSRSGQIAFSHQNAHRDHLGKEYRTVLQNREPQDHPRAPSADVDWVPAERAKEFEERSLRFPGLEMRKVDMTTYNRSAEDRKESLGNVVSEWRQLVFYRLLKTEEEELDLNLQACAHLYASDRNSLFMIQRAYGLEKIPAQMGSLAHTVTFHGQAEAFQMIAANGVPRWFVQEAWTSNSGANRVTHNSRLWDYDRGQVIATTLQDGMMRVMSENENPKL